jgi:hypothetical protein
MKCVRCTVPIHTQARCDIQQRHFTIAVQNRFETRTVGFSGWFNSHRHCDRYSEKQRDFKAVEKTACGVGVDKNTRTTAIHMRQNLKQICRHLLKYSISVSFQFADKIYIIPRKKFEENLYSSKISMKRYKEENDLDWKYLYDINSKKMIEIESTPYPHSS